jgi:lipopolysaccharide biosynthesis glycosyltransferase
MVTPDVSQAARSLLATVSRVVEISYLSFSTSDMKTKRQQELYKTWMSESYTKWQALAFTEYKKVLFVDADILVVENIDHLFELPAPAGTFSTPWAREFDASAKFDLAGYPTVHGETVDTAVVEKSLKNGGYTFIASVVLLEPSKSDLCEYVKMVDDMQPFGFDNFSTPDEQSLAYFYIKKSKSWTHIHQRYNFIVHKINWLRRGDKVTVPHVLHYFSSKKPWLMTTSFARSIYNTDKLWWHILRCWYKRTLRDVDLPLADELKNGPSIVFTMTRMDREFFPWITALAAKFPALFKLP